MIDDIRRRISLTRQDAAAWDLDQRLEVEAPFEENEIEQAPVGLPVDLIPSHPQTMEEYYTGLIGAAMAQGGKFRGQEIPLHWLRMTLSGLQGRRMVPMASWDSESAGPGIPGDWDSKFEDMFPARGS